MTLYLAMAGTSFRKHLAYRSEVWIWVVISVLYVAIEVAVWDALIGEGEVAGITLREMVTYSIVYAMTSRAIADRVLSDVDQKLRSGDVAVDLVKPYSYPLTLVADQLGRTAFSALFSSLPTVAVAALLFGFDLPPNLWTGMAYVAAFVICLAISFALACIVGMLGFHFLATFHFQWALGALRTLFAGTMVPLWFFPDGLRTVASALPFQFVGFVPGAIWLGEYSLSETFGMLALGMAWTIGLGALGWWMLQRITTRLVVQGG
jgi:ABC-2 type transport system permease protein